MDGGEYGKRGCDLFCFHFVLGSNRRSVSDALCLAVQTRWEAVLTADDLQAQTEALYPLSGVRGQMLARWQDLFSHLSVSQ